MDKKSCIGDYRDIAVLIAGGGTEELNCKLFDPCNTDIIEEFGRNPVPDIMFAIPKPEDCSEHG